MGFSIGGVVDLERSVTFARPVPFSKSPVPYMVPPRLLLLVGARGVRGVLGTLLPVTRREALLSVSRIVHCRLFATNHKAHTTTMKMTVRPQATAIPTIAPVLKVKAAPLPPVAPADAPPEADPTPPAIDPVPSVSVIVGKDEEAVEVGEDVLV